MIEAVFFSSTEVPSFWMSLACVKLKKISGSFTICFLLVLLHLLFCILEWLSFLKVISILRVGSVFSSFSLLLALTRIFHIPDIA